jgi:hypothetical protein|tara:strand:- start:375 stop:602 length:228 start_codon:yes stop_codon:yes gene_type:complete
MAKEFISGSEARTIGSLNLVSSDTLTGKPTGQGFGAARKGPAVQGKIEAVVDSVYPQGKSFTIGGVKSASTLGVK